MKLHNDFENRAFGFARSYPSQPKTSNFRIAFIGGPHGLITHAGKYGKVVIIPSGFGIAAELSFLEEAIQGFNYAEV